MATKKAAKTIAKKTKTKADSKTRATLVRAEALPRETLQEAERVARVIHDTHAGKDASWDQIAAGLELGAASAKTKYLIWSAVAYGLVQKKDTGAYSLAESGRRIVAPISDVEEREGRRKAAVTPSILSKFFAEYEGHPIPEPLHFANVLESKFGIPRERTSEAADLIRSNGTYAGLLVERGGRTYVDGDAPGLGSPASRSSEDAPNVERQDDAPDYKNVCFYITPIGEEDTEVRKHADMVLVHLVTPAANDHKLIVVRADKIAKSGLISQQIFEYLTKARVCVADLSFGNPNAFYELGVRHVCKLPAVQIIRKGDRIPFDVAQGRTITVDTSDVYTIMDKMASARRELSEHLGAALADGASSSDNPVHFYLPSLRISFS